MEKIVDALLESDPVTAYYAGDHRFDDRLPDLSDAGVRETVTMLGDASNALAEIDDDVLSVQDRVDHAMLSHAVDARLFELTATREREWNPLVHNPGPLLHGLIARPFAPAEERLETLAARLGAVPDALATARGVLRDCPRVHLETAVGQFAGVVTLIRDQLPSLYLEAPGAQSTVEPLAATAIVAIEEFTGWLTTQLDGAGRDARLGRRLWEGKLWLTLDTELTAADLLEAAYRHLDVIGEQIRSVASEFLGEPAADDETVRRALDLAGEQRPTNDTILELATDALGNAKAIVLEHDLVTVLPDPLVIQEMPEFARGVAAAYCDAVGPLETADLPTFFAISPTPSDWPAVRVESFYREYNRHMVRNLTVHEAMPGHYLQLSHARRFRGTSAARAVCESGTFIEGWAVYAEELMASVGHGGAAVRLQQLKMALRMTLNAILDQLIHCEDLTESDAMDLMMRRGFQEEGEAAGKWRRALLTSTQLSTYFVGYTEVSAIGRARPAGTSLRSWHDAMLAHGSPAPRHLRTLLGVVGE